MTAARRIDLAIVDGDLVSATAADHDAAPLVARVRRPSPWRRQWITHVDGWAVTITVAPRPCRDDP